MEKNGLRVVEEEENDAGEEEVEENGLGEDEEEENDAGEEELVCLIKEKRRRSGFGIIRAACLRSHRTMHRPGCVPWSCYIEISAWTERKQQRD